MAMAKFTVDTTNKLFIAKAAVVTFDVKVDLYSDAKEHWLLGGVAAGFNFPIRSVGGDSIDVATGTKVPLYAFLREGWRIRPDEADHTLGVTGAILLVDGGGDPFVDTVGAFTVRINFQQPVQAIVTETATSGLTAAESANLAFMKSLEEGRWNIGNDPLLTGSEVDALGVMTFFQKDNATQIAQFELLDGNGVRTITDPLERKRLP